MKQKQRLSRLWHMLAALLICLVYLAPFYVVLMVSLKPISDTSSRLAPPAALYLENYTKALQNGQILNAIKNNTIILVLSVLVIVAVGSMAAYPLARNQSRTNELIRRLFMGIMMITPLTILVGLYSILSRIKAISTYWGIVLVLSAFGVPMAVFLYSNFISAIPKELDEAAMIDGAGRLKTFFLVIFPQLGPVTVTVVIMQGVTIWNNYLFTHYILQKRELFTVTQVIQGYFSTTSSDYGGAASVAVLGMLPVVIAFAFLQKYFIQGTVDSAIK